MRANDAAHPPIIPPIAGERYALLVARFNEAITQSLLAGALRGLEEQGVPEASRQIFWVPGAFELPLLAKRIAASGHYTALICLGAIIRGETAHFEYVAQAAASGILEASLATGVPIIFSVLTTYTWEQAEARTGVGPENHGYQGAYAAREMVQQLYPNGFES